MKNLIVSIIIPTFNRASILAASLNALAESNFDFDGAEVIVVDDGSSDETPAIRKNAYPFALRYFRQPNQGDAIARNYGTRQSNGELLLFLDDDVQVTPDTLTQMRDVHRNQRALIVVGELIPASPGTLVSFERAKRFQPPVSWAPVPFTECCSGLLMIGRGDFFRLGMMKPLEGAGSSIWCDVEFAYRAEMAGFSFIKILTATGVHYDHTLVNLRSKCIRMHRAAKTGVLLFQRHASIREHLPMFRDKTPIRWSNDPVRLIVRKVARAMTATRPTIRLLELAHSALPESNSFSTACASLERWIIGSYIYRGYRRGLCEFISASSES